MEPRKFFSVVLGTAAFLLIDRLQPLYDSLLGKINPDLPNLLIIAIVITCIVGLIYYRKDITHKGDLLTYSNHLKILMDSVKENLNTSNNNPHVLGILNREPSKDQYPNYFNAIRKSPKKMAILQHLITDISNPEDQSPNEYLWFSTIQNAIEQNKKEPHYGNFKFIQEGLIPFFNRDFNHIFHSVYDGQPIWGACDGCIEFYAGRNPSSCRRLLDRTKKERYKWYYSIFD